MQLNATEGLSLKLRKLDDPILFLQFGLLSTAYCCPNFNPALKCPKPPSFYKTSNISQILGGRKLRMQLCTQQSQPDRT